MTILSDFLARAKSVDITGEIISGNKIIHRELKSRANRGYPEVGSVPMVQSITPGNRTGGTMTLTIYLVGGISFTTANLAYNANAAATQSAIDTAAASAVTNYSAGDIAVTGGPFATSNTILTFSGNSVKGAHPVSLIDGTNLTGGGLVNPIASVTTPGKAHALDVIHEVQAISTGDRTGGTATLTFVLENGESFTTAAIIADDEGFEGTSASDFQSAIDTAAASAITGYSAGDIKVTGDAWGASSAGEEGSGLIFTFSGDSVLGNHSAIVINDSLTGGTTSPVVSLTTAGCYRRFWFGSLKALGVVTGTDPAFQASPSGQYTVNQRASLSNYPSRETIVALCREATIQEGKDWETEILPQLGYKKIVEHLER